MHDRSRRHAWAVEELRRLRVVEARVVDEDLCVLLAKPARHHVRDRLLNAVEDLRRGLREAFGRILLRRAHHEVIPNRPAKVGAVPVAQALAADRRPLQRLVNFGVSAPCCSNKVGRVANKPQVLVLLRRARLAGGWHADVEALSGAVIHHLGHREGDPVRHVLTDRLCTRDVRRLHLVPVVEVRGCAVEVGDLKNRTRFAVDTTVGERLVHRGHRQRRGVLRTKRNGWHCLDLCAVSALKAKRDRHVSDLTQVERMRHRHVSGVDGVGSGVEDRRLTVLGGLHVAGAPAKRRVRRPTRTELAVGVRALVTGHVLT